MPGLLDAYGRPVNPALLKRPSERRQPKTRSSVQFAADPDNLVGLFKKADEGDPRGLQQLLAEVEQRDGHIGGVLDTRYQAAVRVPWRAVAETDDAIDVEIAEAVQRDIYDARWFRGLCRHLLSATLMGWSVCELEWETGDVWRPKAIRWVDPTLTAVDPEDDQRLLYRDPADLKKTRPIDPYTAVIHAASGPSGPLYRRGLGRALAILYSLKRLGLQSFASFVELYGVARPVVSYLEGSKDEDLQQLLADLEGWQHAGYLTKPAGINLAFPEPARSSSGTEPVHAALVRLADEQASKRIVGQTMTSDAGSSRSQAEVHERVAEWIREGDLSDLRETILRDVVEPYVRLNYGADVTVPKGGPQLEANGQRAFQLEVMKVLVPLGLEVEQSVARDLAGLPEPAKGARILGGKAGASSAAMSSPTTARRAQRGPAAFGPGVLYAKPTPAPKHAHSLAKRTSERHGTTILAAPTPASIPRSALAAEPAEGDDFMDTDGGAAAGEGWREGMQPFVDGVVAAGDAADSFESFLAKLREETTIDADKLVRSLATWTMSARGVGDGTDET